MHILWWTILPIESIIIVTISSVWRMLSFKATHMNERLSLLTMIIIGEGVIGATKTVGYLWPIGYAPTWGNALALLSVVFLLVSASSFHVQQKTESRELTRIPRC